jgi:hypothetical protein
MYLPSSLRAILVCLGLLLITPACGGGGGSASVAVGGTSGTGIDGGTSGTGISGGSVNSFGSVVVNGTTYLTSSDDAGIETEFAGPTASFGEADLAPGMLVQVDWRSVDEGGQREAQRITYLPELSGPLTAAWTAPSGGQPAKLSVAGRTVELPIGSVFDDRYGRTTAGVVAIKTPEALEVGADRLEVSGFLIQRDAASGASVIRATRVARIGRQDSGNPTETVTGVVTASSAGSFEIVDASGAVLNVTFDSAAVTDDSLFEAPGTSRLRDSAAVRVTGQLDGNAMAEVSEISRPLDELQPISGEADIDGEFAGLITAEPDNDNIFRVANQAVRFNDDTDFADGTAADLQLGRRVTVEGELREGGGGRILEAEEIDFENDAEVELEDTVAGAPSAPLASGERTFETRIGITVLVRPQTVLKDDSDASPDGRLDLDDLTSGDFVEIDGFFDADGRLVAVTLERDDEDDGCELEARVAGSAVVGGSRHYTIAGRPGLVIADVGDDSTLEKVLPGAIGEFDANDAGNCSVRPSGNDIDGEPVDAGFLAGDLEAEDDDDDDDDDD